MALALQGEYAVTATDIASAVGLLAENVDSFHDCVQKKQTQEQRKEGAGEEQQAAAAPLISVQELDWRVFEKKVLQEAETATATATAGADATAVPVTVFEATTEAAAAVAAAAGSSDSSDAATAIGGPAPHLILCSDCVYSSAAIVPLLTVLSHLATADTVVLFVNEMRTAYAELLYAARNWPAKRIKIQEIPITLPELEIMRGPSGRIAAPPVRLCVMQFLPEEL
jgi:hypothetical protein